MRSLRASVLQSRISSFHQMKNVQKIGQTFHFVDWSQHVLSLQVSQNEKKKRNSKSKWKQNAKIAVFVINLEDNTDEIYRKS